jgi:hypothetical protein
VILGPIAIGQVGPIAAPFVPAGPPPATLKAQIFVNQAAWKSFATTNGPLCNPVTDACAAAAVATAAQQCSADATFFKHKVSKFQNLGLWLVLLSAAFTGVGASSTIANAKVYSTLGGTTGIGAATTQVNSDISSDQTALNGINSALSALEKLVTQSPAPTPLAIYESAPLYAAQCDAAASTSTANK